MSHIHYIPQPSDLAVLAAQWTSTPPPPAGQTEPRTEELHLALLQPLANPASLAACRNPAAAHLAGGDLTLNSLLAAWRAELSLFPTARVAKVVFDSALPRGMPEGEGGVLVRWDSDGRRESLDALLVPGLGFGQMVYALAMEINVIGGRGVEFGIEYDLGEAVDEQAFKGLERELGKVGPKTG